MLQRLSSLLNFHFLDHEPIMRRVLASLLKRGSVVVDLGANIDDYALLAAGKVDPQGKVHAIECSHEM